MLIFSQNILKALELTLISLKKDRIKKRLTAFRAHEKRTASAVRMTIALFALNPVRMTCVTQESR